MTGPEFDERRFHDAWRAIRIERGSAYSLFTFGESELPYFLVLGPKTEGGPFRISRGEIRITRPLIITPDNASPELSGFFDDVDDDETPVPQFLMARSAAFAHLRLKNRRGETRLVTDNVEEALDRLSRQLDAEEDDRTAILIAPRGLGSLALFRYASERILASAPDNIQELRERGFLP